MKTIIAGSRNLKYSDTMVAIAECPFIDEITEVVCGCARGPDTHGRAWAENIGMPVKLFPPDWDTHGKSAGVRRNVEMGKYADALILVWDGLSRGSMSMLDIAKKRGLKIFVYTPENITYL